MVELSCGHKRRRSDAEENERIALRQTVFNMSICKLNKDIGRKEPSLLRSVLITNTVRQIESEMDSEVIAKYNVDHELFDNHFDHIQQNIAEDIINNNSSRIEVEVSKSEIIQDIINNDNEHKFGAIGDRRKSLVKKEQSTFGKPLDSEHLWHSTSVPTINLCVPPIENVELQDKFSDVDIALYDFDYPSKSILSQADWRVYPTRCAVEYQNHKPDKFFEELDQLMQVLVGM